MTTTTRTKLNWLKVGGEFNVLGQEKVFLRCRMPPTDQLHLNKTLKHSGSSKGRLYSNRSCCVCVCGWRRLPGGPNHGFLLWLWLNSDCCCRVGIEPRRNHLAQAVSLDSVCSKLGCSIQKNVLGEKLHHPHDAKSYSVTTTFILYIKKQNWTMKHNGAHLCVGRKK